MAHCIARRTGRQHWAKMKLTPGLNGPTGCALDPTDNRPYVSHRVGRTGVRPRLTGGGGLFLSTDSGATWRNIFDQSSMSMTVTVDPKNPKVLYNWAVESGAYRSTDAVRPGAKSRVQFQVGASRDS